MRPSGGESEPEAVAARGLAALFSDSFDGPPAVAHAAWASAWRVGDEGWRPDVANDFLSDVPSERPGDEALARIRRDMGQERDEEATLVVPCDGAWLVLRGRANPGWSGWPGESGWHVVASDEGFRHRLEVARALVRLAKRALDAESLLTLDPESGLLNRAAILGQIEQAIARARRDRRPFSVARLDVTSVEGPSPANLSREVVRLVARILIDTVRREDQVARVSPVGFAILFLGGDGQESPAALDRIMRAVRSSSLLETHGLALRVGAMTFHEPVVSAIEALNEAEAMQALDRDPLPRRRRRDTPPS